MTQATLRAMLKPYPALRVKPATCRVMHGDGTESEREVFLVVWQPKGQRWFTVLNYGWIMPTLDYILKQAKKNRLDPNAS